MRRKLVSTRAMFGRYRIGAALGRGGMATVHEAFLDGPDGFSRRVALKRVREGLAGAGDLAKLFSDEARIASHLHHANLVGIVDYGIEDGVPFQALELVEGTTLEALRAELDARNEPLPEAIALHVIREVAHGLAYAHRATDQEGKALALVHRDVSPSNVLIGWNGDVKLSDFGIAFARGRQTETAHGTARGKPSYMAPEQATRGTIDARTDLFGLGCTLHFALTGKSPLEGDDVLLKMLVGEPAAVSAALREDLRAIVAAAIAPERRDRPADADAMNALLDAAYRARTSRDGRSELRAFLVPIAKRAQPVASDAETAATRARPTRAPSRAPWFALSAIAIASALGVGVGVGVWPRDETPALVVVAPDAGAPAGDAAISIDAGTDAPIAIDVGSDAARDRPHVAIVRPPPSSTAPPAPSGSGWLRVVAGCEAAHGGSVTIDERATGDHVPTTLHLAAGTHHVRVVAEDGAHFDRDVDVTAFNTESNPARVRACD